MGFIIELLMSALNLNELQVLVNNFKQEKAKDNAEDYTVKVGQQDGNITLIVYAGDKQIYQLPEHYKLDQGKIKAELWCEDDHCKETSEYNIITDSSPNNKIGIFEEHDNQSDHFYVSATFYDGDNDVISGGYGAELSVQYNQAEPEFIIHDIHNLFVV